MVTVLSKEVRPKVLKKAIRKYKLFLTRCDGNIHDDKVCDKPSKRNEPTNFLPSLENQSITCLEPSEILKEGGTTDEKKLDQVCLKSEVEQNKTLVKSINNSLRDNTKVEMLQKKTNKKCKRRPKKNRNKDPKTSTTAENNVTNTKNVPTAAVKKVEITNRLNHDYLKLFFEQMLKTTDEHFSPILDNISPQNKIASKSKLVNELFSKYVSMDESCYAVHSAVSSITTNIVRILCKLWWDADAHVQKLKPGSYNEVEGVLRDALTATKLLSIYCGIMHESFISISEFWSLEHISVESAVEFYTRLGRNCVKSNDILIKEFFVPAVEAEAREVVQNSAKVFGEFLKSFHAVYFNTTVCKKSAEDCSSKTAEKETGACRKEMSNQNSSACSSAN